MGKKTIIVTHNGAFHTDEVFAVATVILYLGDGVDYEIVRTRDARIIESADYILDVGKEYDPARKRFDHHQNKSPGIHSNGIPMASFGLVWQEFGEEIAGSKEIAEDIKKRLVYFIDALDNGVEISKPMFKDVYPYTISDYLYSYWIDDTVDRKEIDRIFNSVVALAKELIIRSIKKAKNIERDSALVRDVYKNTKDKRIIILESDIAWGKALVEVPDPLIVVHPSTNGENWSAETVGEGLRTFKRRIYFPKSWAGLSGGDLITESGVKDAVFCHKGRFLAVAKTKEGAIEFAEKAISQK